MSPPLIFLATPCHGGQVGDHYLSAVLALQGACDDRGVGLHVELLENDTQITRARARLCARFLAHPLATHLFFVDADIGFAPEAALRLLDAGHEVAGGVYPLKALDWAKVRAAAAQGAADLMAKSVGYVLRFIPTPDSSVQVEGGFANVAYVGTGFLMIARSAIERLAAAHPELVADLGDVEPGATRVPMLFDTMIEPQTGQHLSEDYAFCRRWRALGGEIWADVESRLTHVGPMAFSGSLIEAMRPG
jgi:hypothetical protein